MIRIEREAASPACVAHIRGEIDFAVVPELREALDAVIGDGCCNVVMDLVGVTYADSSALGLLVWIDKRLQPYGGKLVLAGADRNVSRVLELSGLIGVAPSVSAATSVDDALGGLDLPIDQSPPQWAERVEAPAVIESMSWVRTRIVEIIEPLGMPEPDLFDLKVAVGEALANAVRHGSPGGPSDVVSVDVEAFHDRVEVLISDAGHGFDGVATCGDDVYASSGRGVIFMRALMDRVDFLPCSGGGTTVRLVKRLPVAQAAPESA
jgi:anti-anti-sigma factor